MEYRIQPPKVYNVSEARPSLPKLIKRAAQGEEIHLGTRREDEATLISSAALQRYKHLAQLAQRFLDQGQVGAPEEQVPWAGLRRALREGQFAPSGAKFEPKFSRAAAGDEGLEPAGLSWEAMAKAGNRAVPTNEFRRPLRDEDD